MEITWETFKSNLQEFHELSDKIHDNWQIFDEKVFYTDYSTYLIKKLRKQSKRDESTLTFEYHITFDGIYSVPKLCFNVFRTDGSLLMLDEVLNQFEFLPSDNVLEILTQMDHPVLQRPFYCLHPCKTSELMQLTAKNSKNVLVTWLSTVGPSVGLHLDNIYSQLT
ncbi:ubiquitin-like-conjugating enzyme ATG10 isoform X2 [Atheta coriaria]|uniref:ubiquitin-like-conjugating enzyme ATG10 isoform X2 n=1 Tax=Dalotia coriaria TaxID=877792 RepID=UPI0031F469C5